MALTPMTEGIPSDVSSQLLSGEQVYYFSYITFKGGCGSSGSRSNYWIALTNRRVLYKSKVQESNSKTFVERDGALPMDKVSFIEVSEKSSSSGCGCSSTKAYHLQLGSSGGTVIIPIPTKEKGYEIRRVYAEIQDDEGR